MKIRFLGTGTSLGIPVIGSTDPVCLSTDPRDKRLRASILIQWDHFNYIIDCGPDFRQQMLTANCFEINGIIFTHEHADHTAGIDDIRPFYFKQGDINFFADKRVIKALKKRFNYIFTTRNKYPSAPSVCINKIKNKPFKLHNLNVIPIKGYHNTLPVFGFRFNNFAYITDMKTIPEKEMDKLKNLDVLVINALREEPSISHFTLSEALEVITKLNPKKAYLTHISHHLGFHKTVENKLPEHVFLAYDGLTLEL